MSRRSLGILASVAILAVAATGLYQNRHFFHDDAYIVLRYVHNLLRGDGLTWNPGERVEGYTSLLHLLAVAGAGRFLGDLVAAARWSGLASWLAFVAVFAWISLAPRRWSLAGRSPGSGGAAPWVALLLAVPAYPLIIWTLGGLEAPLFTLLVTLGLLGPWRLLQGEGSARTAWGSGLAFGMAALTRPDGLLLGAAGALSLLAVERPPRVRLGLAVASGLPQGLLVGAQAVWRRSYYGEWLPNTYHAKAAGLPSEHRAAGWNYLGDYLETPPFLLPLATVAAIAATIGPGRRRLVAFLGSSVLLYLAFVVRVGGDHMEGFRLFAPLVPHAALLMGLGVEALERWRGRLASTVAVVATVLLAAWQSESPGGRLEDPAAYVGRVVGRHIAEAWPAGSLVALNTAGSTPFHAPGHCYVDMLGINDPHIARRRIESIQAPYQRWPGHAKGDGEYVLSRRPDYIIVGPAFGWPIQDPVFLSGLELRESEAFHRLYEERRVDLDVRHLPYYEEYFAANKERETFIYYQRIDPTEAR